MLQNSSRSRTGFGLAITREIAELYGGSREIGRASLGGLGATLILPRG